MLMHLCIQRGIYECVCTRLYTTQIPISKLSFQNKIRRKGWGMYVGRVRLSQLKNFPEHFQPHFLPSCPKCPETTLWKLCLPSLRKDKCNQLLFTISVLLHIKIGAFLVPQEFLKHCLWGSFQNHHQYSGETLRDKHLPSPHPTYRYIYIHMQIIVWNQEINAESHTHIHAHVCAYRHTELHTSLTGLGGPWKCEDGTWGFLEHGQFLIPAAIKAGGQRDHVAEFQGN